MKICFLAHLSSVRTRRLAQAFRSFGHEVAIVSLTPGSAIEEVAIHLRHRRQTVSHDRTNWHYLTALPWLRRTLIDLRPDVIYAQFVTSYGVLGALVAPRDCPVMLAVQGSDLQTIARRSPLHALAARFALRRANLVLSPADHLTAEVHRLHPQAPVLTLQYGVDTRRFKPATQCDGQKPVVLSARALRPRMGIETVLLAARHLEERKSILRFEVAGDGELRSRLEEDFRDVVECGRIRFIGDLPEEELADKLRDSPLFVSMTESDGTSMTLMEAMACGSFPVVSDIPANRPWIEHGATGYLVPCGDWRRLADLLEQAWSAPDLRKTAAERNVERITSQMDIRVNMARIEAAIRALASADDVAGAKTESD